MLRISVLFLVMSTLAACGPSRAILAVQQEKIRLEATAAEVVAAAGPPDLILAGEGVETFYFKGSDHTVSASLLDDKVVAFDDRSVWPVAAATLAQEADQSVVTGRVRIGQTEADVVAQMGKPSGLTARAGIETLHWLTDDEVDSVVQLKNGVVHGFWDKPTSAFTQNLPTEERDKSTTSGKVRLGMSEAEVTAILGEPDGRSGKDGMTVHRYESDPFFGDEINYAVGYREGKVAELSEHNVSRAEEKADEVAARKAAERAVAQEAKADEARQGFLDNPLVRAAIVGSITAAAKQGSAGRPAKRTVSRKTVRSTAKRTLTINGTKYTGGVHLGRACSWEKSCPSGYSCHMITGKSGMCVQ